MKTTSTSNIQAAQTAARLAVHKILSKGGDGSRYRATQRAAKIFTQCLGGKPRDHFKRAQKAVQAVISADQTEELVSALTALLDKWIAANKMMDALAYTRAEASAWMVDSPAMALARKAIAKARQKA